MQQPNVSNIDQLMAAAVLGKAQLEAFTKKTASDYSGKALLPGLKERTKVQEKMTGRGVIKAADQIFDVARSTVLFINPAKFELARKMLYSLYTDNMNVDNKLVQTVRIKDRYKDGGGARPGYSDIQCILKVPVANYKAHLVELQLNLTSVNEAKHLVHALYDMTRISCSGELENAKYVKLLGKLDRLRPLLASNHFWHAGGPWKNAGQAKSRFEKIVMAIKKLPVKNGKVALQINKNDCVFCSILQELAYPHLYKRKMSEQRVMKSVVINGEEKSMLLPVLSNEEIEAAQEQVFELVEQLQHGDGDYDRAFLKSAHSKIDQWVANKHARAWLKAKPAK